MSLVQKTGANSSGNVTTRTITFSSAPTQHNLLVACITYGNNGTLTLPTGWTLADSVQNGTTCTVALAYAQDCATTNGLVFTIGTSGSMEVSAAEYSGQSTSNALDKVAHNSGSSTSIDSGTTATTTNASELWVASLGYINASNQSPVNPTNGFTSEQINNSTGGTNVAHSQLLDKTVSSTGTANTGVSISASSTWGGVIATFNPATTTSTRTVTETAALLATLTRTVTETAALLATLTRSVSQTAALQATLTRTVTEDAALLATLTRTVSETAALLATLTRSVPETAALLLTSARSVPETVALSATPTRSITETSALIATLTRSVPETASLTVTRTRTIPETASISILGIRTVLQTCNVAPPPPIDWITATARDGNIVARARDGNIVVFAR